MIGPLTATTAKHSLRIRSKCDGMRSGSADVTPDYSHTIPPINAKLWLEQMSRRERVDRLRPSVYSRRGNDAGFWLWRWLDTQTQQGLQSSDASRLPETLYLALFLLWVLEVSVSSLWLFSVLFAVFSDEVENSMRHLLIQARGFCYT